MKGSTLLIILLIIVLAAKFTLPGKTKFQSYLEKEGKNTGMCFAGNTHASYLLFSVEKVNYCETISSDSGPGLKPLIRKPVRTDKYVGLFGTFWKVN